MPTPSYQFDVESGPEQGRLSSSNSGLLSGILNRLSRQFSAPRQNSAQAKPQAMLQSTISTLNWAETREPKYRIIEKHAHGWPRLSAAIDSDPNFMIYRRFGYLRTRLLTYRQDILRELEASLEALDYSHFKDHPTWRATGCREADDQRQPAERKELFQKLNKELSAYDELLLRSQQLYRFDSPTQRNQTHVMDMIWNDGYLSENDRDYIRHVDDLIIFEADKESSWVHEVVGFLFKWCPEGLKRRLFRTDTQRRKSYGNKLGVELLQRYRFNRGVEYLFALFSIMTLIGPIYILNALRNENEYVQNTVVLASTAMFALLLSSATAAERHEVFAVTSAYCAVLVVFTSQGNNGNTPAPASTDPKA